MANKTKTVPAERILSTAANLFARKGFSAVGIREISDKAKVNISMISYYFGGKTGILKAIISEYFGHFDEIAIRLAEEKLPPDELIRKFTCGLIELISSKPDICRVAIIELPIEIPEITNLKVRLLKNNMQLMSKSIALGFRIDDPSRHLIIGPAFLSMIFSHFLLGSIIKKASKEKFDSEFFKRYCETISELFLNGIKGMSKSVTKGKSSGINQKVTKRK